MILIPIRKTDVPKPRKRNGRIYDALMEFQKMKASAVVIDPIKEGYFTATSCASSFYKSAKRFGVPIEVHAYDGKVYLIKIATKEEKKS